MDASQLISQLLGPTYLALGVGGFVNRKHFMELIAGFNASYAVILISGVIALLVGLLMLRFHNIWVADWRVIITIFGWIALIKGLTLLVLPARVGKGIANSFVERPQLINLMLGFCLLIGVIFCYFGYIA